MNSALLSVVLVFCMQNFIHASDRPSEGLTTQTILSIIDQKQVTNKDKVAQIKRLLPPQEGDVRDCCPSPFSALYSEDECAVIIDRLQRHIQSQSV